MLKDGYVTGAQVYVQMSLQLKIDDVRLRGRLSDGLWTMRRRGHVRYRVDFQYGYISFDESDSERAFELFRDGGIRIRRCADIFDDGVVIDGSPIVKDLTDVYCDRSNSN